MSKIFRSVGRKWKKRIEYCEDKAARCQPLPSRCANCSCYDDGQLYYEDFDYCMNPLTTTPPATTTDKPTTRHVTTPSSTATTTASKNVIDTTESTTSKSTATKSTSSPPSYTPEQSTTPSTSFKSGVSMTSSKVGSTTSVAWEASGGKKCAFFNFRLHVINAIGWIKLCFLGKENFPTWYIIKMCIDV